MSALRLRAFPIVLIAVVGATFLAWPTLTFGATPVRFERIAGVTSPGTPSDYDKVGILEVGPRNAPNILVLNPGTSAGAAYFQPLAKTIVSKAKGWQVWSVERRENLLEDQTMPDKGKAGSATPSRSSTTTSGTWATRA
jgi:hypothetical protein